MEHTRTSAARLTDIEDSGSLRSRIRRRRMAHLVRFVDEILAAEQLDEVRICDLGGNFAYWSLFPFERYPEHRFSITLVNIEEDALYEERRWDNATFAVTIGDACRLDSVGDAAFDIVHSNSVIEHVGGWRRIESMAEEVRRVGRRYFVQTPNYWFPIEPHYVLPLVHFLPRPAQTRLLELLRGKSLEQAAAWCDGNRMLTRRELRALFPDAQIVVERFFLFSKSFIARSPR